MKRTHKIVTNMYQPKSKIEQLTNRINELTCMKDTGLNCQKEIDRLLNLRDQEVNN